MVRTYIATMTTLAGVRHFFIVRADNPIKARAMVRAELRGTAGSIETEEWSGDGVFYVGSSDSSSDGGSGLKAR